MNHQEIEQKIIANCERVIALGWKLRKGITCLFHDKECCALGSGMVLDPDRYRHLSFGLAKEEFGMDQNEALSFIYGFDDMGMKVPKDADFTMHEAFYRMGRRISEKYNAVQHYF